MRDGDLDFFDVIHDGRHQAAGRVRLEELRALLDDFIEDGVTQVSDGGEADIVDEVIREVVANTFDEEYGEDGERHHGPDVVDPARNELVQVQRAVENRVSKKQDRRICRGGVQDAVENGANEQRDHAVGGSHRGH